MENGDNICFFMGEGPGEAILSATYLGIQYTNKWTDRLSHQLLLSRQSDGKLVPKMALQHTPSIPIAQPRP